MRLAAYLSTSRHGISYFRFPIPMHCHPTGGRGYVKVSLATRESRDARQLARFLAVAAQSILSGPKVLAMRYDELREHVRDHFGQFLRDFLERSASDGPASGPALEVLTKGVPEIDAEDWGARYDPDGTDALVRAFCAKRGIDPVPEGRARQLMLTEIQKGYKEYVTRALEHTTAFNTLNMEQAPMQAPHAVHPDVSVAQVASDALPLADTVERYFDEISRSGAIAAKTEGDKRDALALMSELTGDKPPAHMTKVDAQNIKAAIMKLPKNRSKNPATRNLTLSEMLS
ncbi:hypothetical protein, partial [Pararhodobacter sp. SW119]|uniref:hypothetical protein n=1 Tax=Pararhodobacter sp. SW119 TaxID=2780075 RepID=UPI001AE02122